MSVLTTYFDLLEEAHSASEEVDDFDVNSGDPESFAAWRVLVTAEVLANRKLVEFASSNRGELLRLLA